VARTVTDACLLRTGSPGHTSSFEQPIWGRIDGDWTSGSRDRPLSPTRVGAADDGYGLAGARGETWQLVAAHHHAPWHESYRGISAALEVRDSRARSPKARHTSLAVAVAVGFATGDGMQSVVAPKAVSAKYSGVSESPLIAVFCSRTQAVADINTCFFGLIQGIFDVRSPRGCVSVQIPRGGTSHGS